MEACPSWLWCGGLEPSDAAVAVSFPKVAALVACPREHHRQSAAGAEETRMDWVFGTDFEVGRKLVVVAVVAVIAAADLRMDVVHTALAGVPQDSDWLGLAQPTKPYLPRP